MNVPPDLRYTETHEWARREADGTITVGITDHAQQALGDIVFLELPEVGRRVEAGKECAVVESVKAASDIYAPLSGEIVARNDAVIDAPEEVNKDAYAAWLFRIQPSEPAAFERLLDAAAYTRVAEAG